MEHSFQEVMKERERMCNTIIYANNGCCDCPLQKSRLAIGEIGTCYRYFTEHYNDAENIVMAWAAENPEPVYPTWKEWLEEYRVVVHFDSVNEKGTKVKWELTNKSNCSIPADIAQKLGIEPKEE